MYMTLVLIILQEQATKATRDEADEATTDVEIAGT